MRAPASHVSDTPTPYAVVCFGVVEGYSCGKIYLTAKGYNFQMGRPDVVWKCPICGSQAGFEEDDYENLEE